MDDIRQDFLRSLEFSINGILQRHGLSGVQVNASEKDGKPVVELHGGEDRLRAARGELRAYTSLLVFVPTDPVSEITK